MIAIVTDRIFLGAADVNRCIIFYPGVFIGFRPNTQLISEPANHIGISGIGCRDLVLIVEAGGKQRFELILPA